MTFTFDPFLSPALTLGLALLILALPAVAVARRLRGGWLRLLAGLALVLALTNPAFVAEDREALSTVVPVIVDRSQSQEIDGRATMTDAALDSLKAKLGGFSRIEPRIVEVKPAATEAPQTALFGALQSAIGDLPASRIGGAILLTDGQVHDVPKDGAPAGFTAPLHGLVTGRADERDRRIELIRAPRFGITGEEQELAFRVVEDGRAGSEPVDVTIRINGNEAARLSVVPGTETPFRFTVPLGGNNILELSAAPVEGEISTANNRAVHVIEGIREKLRVLLVSGEPHAGERAWRNLLKSDAGVDLVHFTILRPPEKQDGTPIYELSLIAFPTRELFVDKIDDFDLIIFDRYQHRGVLPLIYYDNIADYVRKGGALLIAAGPEHAGPDSIALTPLATVLPAAPTGAMNDEAFYPRLSDAGKKHPLTRGLDGSATEPPGWGRWFRAVDVEQPSGETLMQDAEGRPLLVVNRAGEGRVAMLLSDQGWLWARGVEGGGPYVSLYRRTAHWLMKEPSLEEEALTATADAGRITIERQTIGDAPGPAEVTLPSGKIERWDFAPAEPGLYRITRTAPETGLYEIRNGDFSTLVHAGSVDAPEFKAMISTTSLLAPAATATGGIVARVAAGNGAVSVPDLLSVRGTVRPGEARADRMVIRMSEDTLLKGVTRLPLFAGFVGLALLLAALSATWWREGR